MLPNTAKVFEELAILPNLGPEEMLKYRKGEAAEELHVSTGSEIFVEIKPQNQQPTYFKTDFYKDHKLKRDDEEDIDNNNNSSISLNESAETLDNSACSTSSSSGRQCYNSPTKRRPPLKKLKTSVNKAVQTRSMGVGESESEKAPNRCRVCGIEHESEDDIATDSRWIGCDFVSTSGEKSECGYWVHEKCMGLYVVSGRDCEIKKGKGKGKGKGKSGRSGDVDVNRLFYCPEHRK